MQGVRCKSCDCLNRAGSLVCRACGEKLPAGAAEPAPGAPPRILRPKKPAPLKPEVDYAKLPKARVETRPRAEPISDEPPRPDATLEVSPPKPQPDTVPEARAEQPDDDDVTQLAANAYDTSAQMTESDEADTEPPAPTAKPAQMDTTPEDRTVEISALPPEDATEDLGKSAPPATPAAARARPTPAPVRAPAAVQGALRRNVRRAASVLRVLVASLVDALIALVAASGAVVAVAPSADKAGLATSGPLQIVELAILNPLLIVVFATSVLAVGTLHQAVLVPRLGGTLGERIAGLSVVTLSNGESPGLTRAALRGIVGTAGGLALAVGPLYALWLSPYRRGPGDLVAGTARVRREGSAR